MKNLKIGTKIAIGFGVLILIACLLGITAIWRMNNVTARFKILSEEHLPAAAQSSHMGEQMLLTMYDVRGYALSGRENYMAEANTNLASLHDDLKASQALLDRSPHLTNMVPLLARARTNIENYDRLVQRTSAIRHQMATLYNLQIQEGNTAARHCQDFEDYQFATIRDEIKTNALSTNLLERINKIEILQNIQDCFSSIRLANVKFQLQGDTNLVINAMPLFSQIQSNIDVFRPMVRQITNIFVLEQISSSAKSYQISMWNVLSNQLELVKINEERNNLGKTANQAMQQIGHAADSNTVFTATETTSTLHLSNQILFYGLILVVIIGVFTAFSQTRLITRGIIQGVQFAREMAKGNLSQRIAVESKDELGNLAESLNQMGDNFRDQILKIRETVDSLSKLNQTLSGAVSVLASSSAQILTTSVQVSTSASETAAAVSETTTTTEEVNQTVRLSSEQAKNVADSASAVDQVAQSGRKASEDSIAGMKRIQSQMGSIGETIVKLSEQSQAIGEIIASVSDLAEQSNLLAVNAAIEAAKAGEQGKGFAVVAQEVRNMAEQSKQATIQVRGILNDIQKAISAAVMATEQGTKIVESGVNQSSEMNRTITTLADNVNTSAQSATQISLSLHQLLTGMDQISSAMQNIRQASQQNVTGIKQTEKAAGDLKNLGEEMNRLVQQNRDTSQKLAELISNYKI